VKFAVISGNLVTDIIVADTLEIAEEVTNQTCIEYTDENTPVIGLGYVDGVFEQPAIITTEEI
jgi:hypothetical protein